MRILFVRHAAAADREEFSGPDMQRPLTPKGEKVARAAFKKLAESYDPPECIFSSTAVRALATAEILSRCFGDVPVVTTNILRPGADYGGLLGLLSADAAPFQSIAVVGHEPDLSEMVGQMLGAGKLRIEVKKAACIVVETEPAGKGALKALLPPRMLIGGHEQQE